MIGLNADEGGQRTGNHGLLKFIDYSYPLFDQGITRAMCKGILKAMNVLPDFPVYMQRGGCKFCYYKSKKEFMAMVFLSPDEMQEVIDLELAIQDEKEEFYNIRDGIPHMEKFRDAIKAQGQLFAPEEIYAAVNDASNCGVFCNR